MKTTLQRMINQEKKYLPFSRFFIGLTLTLAILLAAFEWRSAYRISEPPPGQPSDDLFLDLPPVTRIQDPERKREISPKQKPSHQIKIQDKIEITNNTNPLAEAIEENPEPGIIVVDYPDEPVENERDLFIPVEQMPSFPGGDIELMKFLKKNVNYPKMSKELGITGMVIVEFIVDVDGTMTDIKIAKGVSSDIDKEALRVVSQMPKWIPGSQRNQPVQVGMRLPIRFTLM